MSVSEQSLQAGLQWLDAAREDIDVAERLAKDGVALKSVCYHSQQAAEKALKAGLVIDGKSPPRTHNLETLRRLMTRRGGWDQLKPEWDLQRLTDWEVSGRYPDPTLPPTVKEAHAMLALAKDIMRVITEQFESGRR